jgi:phosphoribosylformylglycinamidine (FGAM) synthase-like enzyme
MAKGSSMKPADPVTLSIQVKDPHETKRVIEAITACLDGVQSTEPCGEQQR